LKLSQTGERSLPVDVSRQPRTRGEYLSIKQEILDRINQLKNQNLEPEIVVETPELLAFAVANHPNPFNPDTSIVFTIPTESKVNIVIYNIRGQRVKTLLNEFKTPGNHSVVWNGTDDFGRSMGSGIYLYRIEAGENVATRRMLLLK